MFICDKHMGPGFSYQAHVPTIYLKSHIVSLEDR